MKDQNKLKLIKINAIGHKAAYINPRYIRYIELEEDDDNWKLTLSDGDYSITEKCAKRLIKRYGDGMPNET